MKLINGPIEQDGDYLSFRGNTIFSTCNDLWAEK